MNKLNMLKEKIKQSYKYVRMFDNHIYGNKGLKLYSVIIDGIFFCKLFVDLFQVKHFQSRNAGRLQG